MQNVVNYPYFICNLTTGKASAFATYAEAEKALILLNTNADAYIVVDTVERCLEEIQELTMQCICATLYYNLITEGK